MSEFYSRMKLGIAVLLLPLSFVFAQQSTVSGTVTDASTGEALVGVTVIQKGTTNGAITDIDGNYTITVSDGATLVFSFIGYSTMEAAATDGASVSLQPDVTNLDELVVTGLATSIKRSNLANNVSTINNEVLSEITTQSTVDGALYGKMTGVNINAAGGAPGGQTAIRLRGISSLSGNNQPLLIIDGVYMSNIQLTNGSSVASGANAGREEGGSNRIGDLNPEDIATIEVLKGASAAAIYGTRANAGVIIITTKRGAEGKTVVNLEQDFGVNTIQNYAGRRNWTADRVESVFGATERANFITQQANGGIFNYEEELYGEQGFISDTRLSVSGGSGNTKFYANISRRDEDGIMLNTGYERNSVRLNLDNQISDKLKVGFSSNYVNSTANRGPVGNENNGGFSVGYNLAFLYDWEDLFPVNGVYPDSRSSVNVIFNRDQILNDETVNRFIQGMNVDYKLYQSQDLQVRLTAQGGVDYFNANTYVYMPETHQVQRGTTQGFISEGNFGSLQFNYNAFAIVDYFFGDNISLSGQFGMSYLDFESNQIISQTTQLVPQQTNVQQGASFGTFQRLTDEEEFGIIGQATLNWDDKIIGTVGVRADKSNLNGDANQYYAFPRASVAVNVANFDFWSVPTVSQLKLRAAYGETGSSARFGSLYTPLGATNVEGTQGLALPTTGTNNQSAQLGDPNLEPETSQEVEFGIDAGFLDGRVGVELTYYVRDVLNLIYPNSSVPLTTGFAEEIRTDFDLRNTGWEVSLNANPVANENFTWNTTLNWWGNEATVERLGVGEFQPSGEGFSLTFGSSYLREGSPATAIAANINGTPTIIGDAAPDYEMSWLNSFTYSNFEFTMLWHWKEGGDVLNLTRLLSDFGATSDDLDDPDLDRSFGNDGAAAYIEDGSYIRLREIGLYYNIPVESDFIDRVRVGLSGKNLITITDYSGYDPETSAFGPSGLSQGIEVAPFPSARQYYFHVAFRF